jgi:hypothetical protein
MMSEQRTAKATAITAVPTRDQSTTTMNRSTCFRPKTTRTRARATTATIPSLLILPAAALLLLLLASPCTLLLLSTSPPLSFLPVVSARLADRSRVVKQRQTQGRIARYHDNGRSIEGPAYRSTRGADADVAQRLAADAREREARKLAVHDNTLDSNKKKQKTAPWKLPEFAADSVESDSAPPPPQVVVQPNRPDFMNIQTTATTRQDEPQQQRHLSSQLSGCCYNYKSYSADSMCALYGHDCEEARSNSHDSGDEDCTQTGLSFIGLSFSVNTASGNPYSYQLCDQFPMENIIDRDYEYVMSMDEDGWLVGGGYKTFDYSGKMP